jgi:hypothetical protein
LEPEKLNLLGFGDLKTWVVPGFSATFQWVLEYKIRALGCYSK